ncbi:MAG: 2'-5' RNA ligase family protein [Pedobacter sp.]
MEENANLNTAVNPLILTLGIDESSQRFFNEMRVKHFPPERNLLKAHLTLFHQLPNSEDTFKTLNTIAMKPFNMKVIGLINLGAGVAYKIESPELMSLRQQLYSTFVDQLILQDKHGFRAHITIQNKTTPEQARSLLAELSASFEPFNIVAKGLDLWEYLGGPWEHKMHYDFQKTI